MGGRLPHDRNGALTSHPPDLQIRGARQHNLRNLDLDLPTDSLVVFCGVSGSGKSSLAFDTLHAEGQRRYLDALARDRGVPNVLPPRVDRIDGLPPTIALSQRDAGRPGRSTVGSVAHVAPVFRVLFARAGTQHCPACGRPVVPRTHDEIVAAILEMPEGARVTVEAPVAGGTEPAVVAEVQRAGFSRLRLDDRVVRLDELDMAELEGAKTVRVVVDRLKVHPDRRSRLADSVRLAARAGGGIVIVLAEGKETSFVDSPRCIHDGTLLPALEPANLSPFGGVGSCPTCKGAGEVDGATCADCGGARLAPAARNVRWRGLTLPDVGARELDALLDELPEPESEIERTTLADIRRRLEQLVALDLAHLALDRSVTTLSGSEWQRLRLARQTANGLSGVLFVLDEPASGLAVAHVPAVVALLRSLVEAGNGVVAVEHHPGVIRAADRVVEFGPGAGRAGGRIVFDGTVEELLEADTSTGRWLSGREVLAPRDGEAVDEGVVTVREGWRRDGSGESLALPLKQVVAITGPAASGKSTLLGQLAGSIGVEDPRLRLNGADSLVRAWVVDEGAGRVARSSPATYLGIWDRLRELLAATREARIRGFTPGTFSLNTRGGRCAACKGTGERRIDMGPLPDVVETCPVCGGRRFEADVLEVRWKGHNAAELL
ncbi:MAG: hypothetical protein AAF211_25070, partial [Myxococcota bacterium]